MKQECKHMLTEMSCCMDSIKHINDEVQKMNGYVKDLVEYNVDVSSTAVDNVLRQLLDDINNMSDIHAKLIGMCVKMCKLHIEHRDISKIRIYSNDILHI